MSMPSKLKIPIGINVLDAARQRISWTFDHFQKIYVSFSGGKDSTVMLHLVMEEAIRRQRKVGVLFVDLEAQYRLTIDFVQKCFDLYDPHIEPFWVCLPIHLRNAVSQFQPQWVCWDEDVKLRWVREMPKKCISDLNYFPFFWKEMEFEEFVPRFGSWYAGEEPCACFVGIRTDESLNRFRSIATAKKVCWQGVRWTTALTDKLCNVYPVYDWRTEDIWTYHAKTKTIYNRLYDRMHQAGLTIHQARICQPYGDDQKRGLWLFHVLEPETWSKVVARVNGANYGAIYAQETGHVMGRGKISKPHGHTWESFTRLLLTSMPPKIRDHFDERILKFITWWLNKSKEKCFFIPDEADPKLEAKKKAPSWRRICKALLRYDYWCKGLSFAPPSSLKRLQAKRKKTDGQAQAYEQAKLIEEAAYRASRNRKRG